jgi:hypothetical protein
VFTLAQDPALLPTFPEGRNIKPVEQYTRYLPVLIVDLGSGNLYSMQKSWQRVMEVYLRSTKNNQTISAVYCHNSSNIYPDAQSLLLQWSHLPRANSIRTSDITLSRSFSISSIPCNLLDLTFSAAATSISASLVIFNLFSVVTSSHGSFPFPEWIHFIIPKLKSKSFLSLKPPSQFPGVYKRSTAW